MDPICITPYSGDFSAVTCPLCLRAISKASAVQNPDPHEDHEVCPTAESWRRLRPTELWWCLTCDTIA